jgi:predicted lysophospholipase L1 biosynthesis ABC-type transport system permease subunit
VLINESAARALWPSVSAVGRLLSARFAALGDEPWTVAGVYADVRSNDLTQPPRPEIMLPLGHLEPTRNWTRSMTLIARTTAAPSAAIASIRAAVREVDANVPVEEASTLLQVVRGASARERFLSTLLGVFALLATVIAAVGVFGVVSFTVARQSREFAIRSALGAGKIGIVATVVRGNLGVTVGGALAGGFLAWLLAPAIGAFLYNVTPRDAAGIALVALSLLVVATLSSLPAALRAAGVEPARAMNEYD